jgi:hypothetical protein
MDRALQERATTCVTLPRSTSLVERRVLVTGEPDLMLRFVSHDLPERWPYDPVYWSNQFVDQPKKG